MKNSGKKNKKEFEIPNQDELLNEIDNILNPPKTVSRYQFLQKAYDFMYQRNLTKATDKALESIDKLIEFSDDGKKRAKSCFDMAKSPETMERVFAYLVSKGPQTEQFAQSLIQEYIVSDIGEDPALRNSKLDRCMMLAAKMGNKELFDLAREYGAEIIRDGHLVINDTGKNALHYACQSDNAEIVKQIADYIKDEANIANPYEIRDSNSPSLNYIRPQHYIRPSLAEKLDIAYELDGNKKGSFSSMVGYYRAIHKVLGQGLLHYASDKFETDHIAAEGSLYAGKYFGGTGVVKYGEMIQQAHGTVASNAAAGVFVGTAAVLSGFFVFGVAKYKKHKEVKRGGYSSHVMLDEPTEQNKQKGTKGKPKYKDDNKNSNYNLKEALAHRDFAKLKDIVDHGHFSNCSKKTIGLMAKIVSFPGKDIEEANLFKKNIYLKLAAKASAPNMGKLLNQLIERGEDGKKFSKEITSELILQFAKDKSPHTRSENIDRLKTCAFMAAASGDVEMLDSAILALKSKGVEKLLDIKTEVKGRVYLTGGQNLMHYACKGGNAKMIKHLEPLMSEEFSQLSPKEKNGARNVFEIEDIAGDTPKQALGREAANDLDRSYGLDPSRNIGFSLFANEHARIEDAGGKAKIFGAAASLVSTTAALAFIIPQATTLGLRVAAAVHTVGVSELLLATVFESGAAIGGLKAAELLIAPAFTKLYKAIDRKAKNYQFEIKAFSEELSKEVTTQTSYIMKNFAVQLEQDQASIISAITADDKLQAVKASLSKAVDKMAEGSRDKERFNLYANNIINKLVENNDALSLTKAIFSLAETLDHSDINKQNNLFYDTSLKFITQFEQAAKPKVLLNAALEYQEKLEILQKYSEPAKTNKDFLTKVSSIDKNLNKMAKALTEKPTDEGLKKKFLKAAKDLGKIELAQKALSEWQDKVKYRRNVDGMHKMVTGAIKDIKQVKNKKEAGLVKQKFLLKIPKGYQDLRIEQATDRFLSEISAVHHKAGRFERIKNYFDKRKVGKATEKFIKQIDLAISYGVTSIYKGDHAINLADLKNKLQTSIKENDSKLAKEKLIDSIHPIIKNKDIIYEQEARVQNKLRENIKNFNQVKDFGQLFASDIAKQSAQRTIKPIEMQLPKFDKVKAVEDVSTSSLGTISSPAAGRYSTSRAPGLQGG